MWRLIMSIVMLVILAVLVAFNASSTTQIRLPGIRMEDASVVAIALVSFVLGVIYSFLLYVFARIDRRRTERLKKKKQKLADREDSIDEREDAIDEREDSLEKQSKEDAKRKSSPK